MRHCPDKGDDDRKRKGSRKKWTSGTGAKCFSCGEFGHIARLCPLAPPGGEKLCHSCGRPGHFSRDCPTLSAAQKQRSRSPTPRLVETAPPPPPQQQLAHLAPSAPTERYERERSPRSPCEEDDEMEGGTDEGANRAYDKQSWHANDAAAATAPAAVAMAAVRQAAEVEEGELLLAQSIDLEPEELLVVPASVEMEEDGKEVQETQRMETAQEDAAHDSTWQELGSVLAALGLAHHLALLQQHWYDAAVCASCDADDWAEIGIEAVEGLAITRALRQRGGQGWEAWATAAAAADPGQQQDEALGALRAELEAMRTGALRKRAVREQQKWITAPVLLHMLSRLPVCQRASSSLPRPVAAALH
eukprot:COSAG01_NODE_14249_length_1477_cov_10.720178_1_plen_360_part_01